MTYREVMENAKKMGFKKVSFGTIIKTGPATENVYMPKSEDLIYIDQFLALAQADWLDTCHVADGALMAFRA